MVHLERVLAKAYRLKGSAAQSRFYEQQADNRAAAMRRLMWNGPAKVFCDYLWEQGRPAIRTIPLLPALHVRCAEAPGLQQGAPQARGNGMRLGLGRDAKVERKYGRGRDGVGGSLLLP